MKLSILKALVKKEVIQIRHDPSSILIAFVLPLILLFIFGYGVNLDNANIKIGLALEENTQDINSLARAFTDSQYLRTKVVRDRRALESDLVKGKIKGIVVVPRDFSVKAALDHESTPVQLITDGSEPNMASFVESYVNGVVQVWLGYQAQDRGQSIAEVPIAIEPRFWYNPELKSRNFLIPGSIAIIMTLIGTLLTSLVIAREWERGTMESLISTPVTITQILLGKLIPYFVLGLGSMVICWIIAVTWYKIPFHGSFFLLLLASSAFLLASLGQGLLISTIARDQFMAYQIALMSAFLPSFMLSGFVYEIVSMPKLIQVGTYAISARYFINILATLFLVGSVWSVVVINIVGILFLAVLFFVFTFFKSSKRLDA